MVYVAGSLLTYCCTVWIDVGKDGIFNEYFFNYDSLTVMISAVGLFAFCKNIQIKAQKFRKIITYIGSLTFIIYLIHYPVIMFLTGYGVRTFMIVKLPRFVFYMAFIGVTFVLSLILAILFSVTGGLIIKGTYKIRNVIKM